MSWPEVAPAILMLFIAAMRLCTTPPNSRSEFRIPAMGLFAALSAILIRFIPPAQLGADTSPVTYALGILVGIIVLAVPPQIIYRFRRPKWTVPPIGEPSASAGD